MTTPIAGMVAPGFEPVAEAFAGGFDAAPEMGAALCVMRDGVPIINLWGGVADRRSGRTWTADTPTVAFSCTKGLASLLVARLVEGGRIDYEAPLARYWPEFAAAGKGTVSVAEVLAHRAGLSAPRMALGVDDIVDWERMVILLAAQEPLWPPGTGYDYHALTHGWLTGELVRRVTGQTIGQYFNSLVTEPLGVSAWIGLPEGEAERVAHIVASPSLEAVWAGEAEKPEPSLAYKATTLGGALPVTLVSATGGFNDQRVRAAELAGAGVVTSAAALATIWSAAVTPTHGVRLIGDETIALATRTRSEGAPVSGGEGPYSRWGAGFQLDSATRRYLTDEGFGHDGAGGQVGFADPRHRVGFGFVTNWMMGPEDQRATAIIDALRPLLTDAA